MKKINIKEKLFITAVFLAVVTVLWIFEIPCIFNYLFDIECIGCGMTRAFFSALKLDFSAAFYYHKMFWSLPILYAYFLFDGKIFSRFTRSAMTDWAILFLIAIGFVFNWIF